MIDLNVFKSLTQHTKINRNPANRFTQDKSLNCIVSLSTIYYNQVLSKNQSMIQNENSTQLQLMNQVFPYIGQMTDYQGLANYLARFDYNGLLSYCDINGLEDIKRHSKGIYPYPVDKWTPIYFPFSNKNPYQYGNRNWKLARQVLKVRYHTKKRNLNHQSKLFYSILLGNQDYLQQSSKQNPWNLLWSKLYIKFQKQTLQKAQSISTIPQIGQRIVQQVQHYYNIININNFTNNLDKIILSLSKLILRNNPSIEFGMVKEILQNLINAPPNKYIMLSISMFYTIFQQGKFQQGINKCKQYFINCTNDNYNQYQCFNQIFRSNQQIIQYYQKTNRLCSKDYIQIQIVKKIAYNYLQHNSTQILKILDYLPIQQQFQLILKSEQLTDRFIGHQLLKRLIYKKQQLIKFLRIQSSKNQNVEADVQYFIICWQSFHKGVYNQDLIQLKGLIERPVRLWSQTFSNRMNHPFKYSNTIYLILQSYASLISISKNINYENYLSEEFRKYLKYLQPLEIDNIWSILADSFLNDEDLLFQLLDNRQ